MHMGMGGGCNCGCHQCTNCNCNQGWHGGGGGHEHWSREMLEQIKAQLERKLAWVNDMLAKGGEMGDSDETESKDVKDEEANA